ncbi:GLPGLI family protein [uncultured Duncaniella sp.]|uniref:GLPGLI family protein n=1 Tax=uncultured Duncaniella sp. TaxID=2768039 RepID=UPI0025EB927D|nr:GLPGLI family protein [uncultured Duncaniella sp.]
MKKLVLSAIIALTAMSVMAADYPKAQIAAVYVYKYLTRHADGHDMENTDNMMLLASPSASRFFSINKEQYDSLMATPGGKKKYNLMLREAMKDAVVRENDRVTIDMTRAKIPLEGSSIQVVRKPGEDTLEVYGSISDEDYIYPVAMSDLVWEIGDSVRTILGYECQQAVADYHGRRWTAWFAPDVPVASGPWQLMGLPGLIMEAGCDGGEYSFTITGLEATDRPITPRPGTRDLFKTTRKQFLAEKRDRQLNPEKYMPGLTIANRAEATKARMAHDLIETDYR